jgi:hypothetical protein
MESNKQANLPNPSFLPPGVSVKDLESKLDGRPSIFIGCSVESLSVAKMVKKCFETNLYEVDIWDEGIFAKTRSFGGQANNVEQLKNFSDIYDFAIFLFVPDDKIISQTRTFQKNDGGDFKNALATRHNVVFEFGLFLGRLGARKSFILFDNQVEDFVDHFFTDLKENLEDVEREVDPDWSVYHDFRLELYSYESNYRSSLNKSTSEISDNPSIIKQVELIKARICSAFNTSEIGFLPSTSLAIGYFNNFIEIVVGNINEIRDRDFQVTAEMARDSSMVQMVESIQKCKKVCLYIIIPDSIESASHRSFKDSFESSFFEKRSLPGITRNMTVKCRALDRDLSEVWVFDVPTTMNTSREAIDMLTPHQDIRRLLSEKERRGFRRALEEKISRGERNEKLRNIRQIVKIISWRDYEELTSEFFTQI